MKKMTKKNKLFKIRCEENIEKEKYNDEKITYSYLVPTQRLAGVT